MSDLGRSRVVVVGASSGLGRAIGIGLARRGASVALLARRVERLAAAAAEAGPDAVAVACDVSDERACEGAIARAVDALGGLDALVYCAAMGPLRPLAESDGSLWRRVLDTNVTGAALTTRAALPHLDAAGGRAVYLSSTSASLTPPWTGLGAYAVSKAALDKLVEAWRVEHPSVTFVRVVVGNTAGGEGDSATEFAAGWDADVAAACFAEWHRLGYLDGGLVDVGDLVDAVASTLGPDDPPPTITVIPGA